jgi:hypothetical protein
MKTAIKPKSYKHRDERLGMSRASSTAPRAIYS